jgi:exopolyphosphatase / guanosine-5'-triphosphate,3'-diphosphate pyrophosphatase
VTSGRRLAADILVCDIGGGSTEIAAAGPRGESAAFGLRAGSATLSDRLVAHDPPTDSELVALADAARELVHHAPKLRARRLVAVGGTATNLIRMLPAAELDRVLTHDRLREIIAALATEPAAQVAELYGVQPRRARLLPAGAAILDALLRQFGAQQAEVVDAGIREGIVLASSRTPAWRRELRGLSAGWGPPSAA